MVNGDIYQTMARHLLDTIAEDERVGEIERVCMIHPTIQAEYGAGGAAACKVEMTARQAMENWMEPVIPGAPADAVAAIQVLDLIGKYQMDNDATKVNAAEVPLHQSVMQAVADTIAVDAAKKKLAEEHKANIEWFKSLSPEQKKAEIDKAIQKNYEEILDSGAYANSRYQLVSGYITEALKLVPDPTATLLRIETKYGAAGDQVEKAREINTELKSTARYAMVLAMKMADEVLQIHPQIMMLEKTVTDNLKG